MNRFATASTLRPDATPMRSSRRVVPGPRSLAGAIDAGRVWWRALDAVGRTDEPRAWKLRLRFVAASFGQASVLARVLGPRAVPSLRTFVREHPVLLGALLWPHVHKAWTPAERFGAMATHLERLHDGRSGLAIGPHETLDLVALDPLVDAGESRGALRFVVDRAPWFLREGGLVLNLFEGDVRLYSLAFSFAEHDGRPAALIGALQGSKVDGALERYRDLTKALHGQRPRDLMVDTFRMLCRALRVPTILAVDDASRHQRHAFFGGDGDHAVLAGNYDELWAEHGGEAIGDGLYRFASDPPRRTLDDVPSRKRAQYRRRYEFLDALEASLAARLAALPPRLSPTVPDAAVAPRQVPGSNDRAAAAARWARRLAARTGAVAGLVAADLSYACATTPLLPSSSLLSML